MCLENMLPTSWPVKLPRTSHELMDEGEIHDGDWTGPWTETGRRLEGGQTGAAATPNFNDFGQLRWPYCACLDADHHTCTARPHYPPAATVQRELQLFGRTEAHPDYTITYIPTIYY